MCLWIYARAVGSSANVVNPVGSLRFECFRSRSSRQLGLFTDRLGRSRQRFGDLCAKKTLEVESELVNFAWISFPPLVCRSRSSALCPAVNRLDSQVAMKHLWPGA